MVIGTVKDYIENIVIKGNNRKMKKIANVKHLRYDEKFIDETQELAHINFKSPNNSRSYEEVLKDTLQGKLGEGGLKESIPNSRFGDGIKNDVIGIMDKEEERIDAKASMWDGDDDTLPKWWNIGRNEKSGLCSYNNIFVQANSNNLDTVVKLYINENNYDVFLRWKADAQTFESYICKGNFDIPFYYNVWIAIKNGDCIEYKEEA